MTTRVPDSDGSQLLISADVEPLLVAAVAHTGGKLLSWQLHHIDTNPKRFSTATYAALVDWEYGRRTELLGVSARAGGLTPSDVGAEVFADGERTVAVWRYPYDPDLPGLARAAYAESMAEVCNTNKVFGRVVQPSELKLQMISYRPRRRAVLSVSDLISDETVYVKVLREQLAAGIAQRHQLLVSAGVPAPEVLALTDDYLLVLARLGGESLADAIFQPQPPCTAESIIALLDAMPAAVAMLDRRPSWPQMVGHYTGVIQESLPQLERRLNWLARIITDGLSGLAPGAEPTHGDFHEGQIQVNEGKVVGLLDVDTIGPGRRADDLACLVAHLSTIQRMSRAQEERTHTLLREWVPVFDERVDPVELRLRAAGVVLSLATGPFRGQEPDWEAETYRMVGSAEALVRQVG